MDEEETAVGVSLEYVGDYEKIALSLWTDNLTMERHLNAEEATQLAEAILYGVKFLKPAKPTLKVVK